ncbi:MAG: hypothetical protein JWQ27_1925 [Ferruginibacter sp.]|nr:hypothetical protein [Ferruginibacter sp.]
MERVETLLNKLQGQLKEKASADAMLTTVQMLQSELMHLKAQAPAGLEKTVALHFASSQPVTESNKSEELPSPPPEVTEEKTVEVLQLDEAEVEAELEEIKRNAEERNKFTSHNKPKLLFDPVEDTPTLTHQQPVPEPAAVPAKPFIPEAQLPAHSTPKEIHETIVTEVSGSLNDKLKQSKIELSDSLQEVPIRDLKKGIGVNDRFLFIKELFRGDEVMYERSVKTINGFAIFPEAEYWIKRELKLKLGWNDHNEVVKQFDQLIRRRFS